MDLRGDRMKLQIIHAFYQCMEETDFSEITVGQIAQAAMINRSTFYRYFEDKFQLRDAVVDGIVTEFVDNLEVEFLDVDIEQEKEAYAKTLQNSLAQTYTRRRELEILWNQKLLGRNVFEEMIMEGARKLEQEILRHDTISDSKKKFADWYARLLVNNMLVTIRWWFSNSHLADARKVAEMMIRHMAAGTIPTLKSSGDDPKTFSR